LPVILQSPSDGRNDDDKERLGSIREMIISDSNRACRFALASFTSAVTWRMRLNASSRIAWCTGVEYALIV